MILNEVFTLPVPNGLDPKAAALTEPFSVAARAVRRGEPGPGSVAVVLGLGPIGLGVVAVLKARGRGPVVAVDPGVVAGKELDIRGSFGGSPGEYRQTLRDVAEGRIDAGAVITGVTGLGGLAWAIAELGEPERHAKIVVDPSLVAG
ncbi:hypothetical protein [Kitasatospora acidiphila]|uniref:hypothetical protein n=1 Tax=Kitasatospora acidiphila TaxID=2567942 RepID=UPI003C75A095